MITTAIWRISAPLKALQMVLFGDVGANLANQRLQSAGDNDQGSKRLQRCALRKFHVTDGQNPYVQITSDRRSKYAWAKCVLCIPNILSGSPIECWLHTCDTCLITTWRLGLKAPLVARNNWTSAFDTPCYITGFTFLYPIFSGAK